MTRSSTGEQELTGQMTQTARSSSGGRNLDSTSAGLGHEGRLFREGSGLSAQRTQSQAN